MNSSINVNNLIQVGFWKDCKDSERHLEPLSMVDNSWYGIELEAVLKYIENGYCPSNFFRYRGMAICRICKEGLGNTDIVGPDNIYMFPEKYEHYIIKHNVKPPQHFIDHCVNWYTLQRNNIINSIDDVNVNYNMVEAFLDFLSNYRINTCPTQESIDNTIKSFIWNSNQFQDMLNQLKHYKEIYNCLHNLVELKDYKDNNGKDDYYKEKQPLLWEQAREALESFNRRK